MKDQRQKQATKSWLPDDVKEGGFTMVPHLFFELAHLDKLSAVERSLVLSLIANIRSKNPVANASYSDLARTSGWSRSAVVDGMERLAQRRTPSGEPAYFSASSGRASAGPNRTNSYSLEPLVMRLRWLAKDRRGESNVRVPRSTQPARGHRKRKKPDVEGFGTPDHDTLPSRPDREDEPGFDEG